MAIVLSEPLPINQSRRNIQKRWVRFILSKFLTHSNLETHAVYILPSVTAAQPNLQEPINTE